MNAHLLFADNDIILFDLTKLHLRQLRTIFQISDAKGLTSENIQ